jgi:hypothetical protein
MWEVKRCQFEAVLEFEHDTYEKSPILRLFQLLLTALYSPLKMLLD